MRNPNSSTPLNSVADRVNKVNDPDFENQSGYYPYDLSHSEMITPRFGEYTPSMCLITAPADRMVVDDNIKTIHTQISGNLLSEVNQYVDTFYIPLRSMFPTNYEKLIPKPTKGEDLPNSALPMFPISLFCQLYFNSDVVFSYNFNGHSGNTDLLSISYTGTSGLSNGTTNYKLARLLLFAYVFSRGQLFDYLGLQFDTLTSSRISELQSAIDDLFDSIYKSISTSNTIQSPFYIYELEQELNRDVVEFSTSANKRYAVEFDNSLSSFRDIISTIYERGKLAYFFTPLSDTTVYQKADYLENLLTQFVFTYNGISDLSHFLQRINESANPFASGFVNIAPVLAYQQCVAQYCTRDSIDNIFTAELYMQLLRSVMFPNAEDSEFSSEPTFSYNGVSYEYDYISCGALYHSLMNTLRAGMMNRQIVWLTLMCIMRRSLRFGDKFATARPNMLAVGDLFINVDQNSQGGSYVTPMDVTKNLLLQRYLNAVNYIGSGFLQYMQSIYGVIPTSSCIEPKYVSHRKTKLVSDIITNTAENQGNQSTNLLGYTDGKAFDVFIDDHGILLSFVSYDVLPVYTSGIDPMYQLADRYDYFNPMIQNIGDQPIRTSEMCGNPTLMDVTFGWTMRNAEYKYKTSRAHGAFCNSLPGFLLKYPFYNYSDDSSSYKINPDFIRDKPYIFDQIVSQATGTSPANYYHFIVSVVNVVKAARKIQLTPPVLF